MPKRDTIIDRLDNGLKVKKRSKSEYKVKIRAFDSRFEADDCDVDDDDSWVDGIFRRESLRKEGMPLTSSSGNVSVE